MEEPQDKIKRYFKEEAPTMSAGAGGVAGIGIGPDGEPGLTPAQVASHRFHNRKQQDDFTMFLRRARGEETPGQ